MREDIAVNVAWATCKDDELEMVCIGVDMLTYLLDKGDVSLVVGHFLEVPRIADRRAGRVHRPLCRCFRWSERGDR